MLHDQVEDPDSTIGFAVPSVRHVVYLHGFASSPQSSKATRFERELTALGVGFSCPDLNLPAFETLTITRMLADAARAIADRRPMLVYQGRQDDSVDPAMVTAWAASRPHVELHLVDDGHQLTASMDEIWGRTQTFLGLEAGISYASVPRA